MMNCVANKFFFFSLTGYVTREGTQKNIPENIQLFDIFSEQIAEVVKVSDDNQSIRKRKFDIEFHV